MGHLAATFLLIKYIYTSITRKIGIRAISIILLTKTTAAQNDVALTSHKVRGLYFMAVVFATIIDRQLCYLMGDFPAFLLNGPNANYYSNLLI